MIASACFSSCPYLYGSASESLFALAAWISSRTCAVWPAYDKRASTMRTCSNVTGTTSGAGAGTGAGVWWAASYSSAVASSAGWASTRHT